MALDWREVLAGGAGPMLLLLALLAVKFGVVAGLGLAFRFGRRAALLTAALLMPFDEVGYVILGSARSTGLLGPRIYALGLTFISVSFILSPLLINLAYRLTAHLRRAAAASGKMPSLAGRVVVAGYGAGGRGVCLILEAARIPFLAVDQDLDRLRLARRLGTRSAARSLGPRPPHHARRGPGAGGHRRRSPFPIGRRLVDALGASTRGCPP